ncbi:glycosyltransferase family 1 protein [Candidatus Microgenomates bacterium]|nr:MAG: glycosyltransferase family 1 protein [Candidatus Microgenomates bacterium]
MKIGIDARLWSETGVGRYIRALVYHLGQIDDTHEYVLFLKNKDFNEVEMPNKRWTRQEADVSWHSLEEQLRMPGVYKQSGADLIHIPYFSVPVLMPTPFVVTIHDLTISHFATGKATTHPKLMYALKRLAYRFALWKAVRSAKRVITVSESTKKELVSEYRLSPGKVAVTYEAGDFEKGTQAAAINTPAKYILYVGNAHPHKNLDQLLNAFSLLRRKNSEIKLVLVGPDDYFYQQLKNLPENKCEGVEFIHNVNRDELYTWYRKALCLVFPSLSEGFGIPGLEAMSQDVPVVCSNISVFHEIYGEAAVYFDQNDAQNIAETILGLIADEKKRKDLRIKSLKKAAEYSWKKMAQETLEVYENCYRV